MHAIQFNSRQTIIAALMAATFCGSAVRQGKAIVGVVHMPAWEPALPQELVWAVQTFIESRVEVSPR